MSRILSVRNKNANALLQTALEELAVDEVVEPVTAPPSEPEAVVVVEDEPESFEMVEDHAELARAADDVNEAHEVVEELEDSEAGLEAIAASLEATMADGGMTPQAAVYLHHAVNAHTRRLGITKKIVPSLESFGGESSRLQATRISMESVKETLLKIWEAVKRAYEAVKNAVLNFFNRYVTVVGRVKGHAEKLLKQVEELKGNPEGEIEVGAAFAKVSINGQFKAPTEVLELFDGVASLDMQGEGSDELSLFKKDALKDPESEKAAVKKAIEEVKKCAVPIGNIKEPHKTSDTSISYKSPVLPGNTVFVVTYGVPSESDNLKTALVKSYDTRFTRVHEGNAEHTGEKKVAPLSKDAMKAYLTDVIKMADKALEAKKEADERAAESMKALEVLKQMFNGDEYDEGLVSAAIRGAGKRTTVLFRIPYEVYKYGAEVMQGYLVLVAKSIKAYKEPAAEKPAAEKPAEEKKEESKAA